MRYFLDTKQRLAIEILLVFVAPILLLHMGWVPLSYRLPVLMLVVVFIVLIVVREKWTLHDLGFRRITTRGLMLYASATIVGVVCVWLYTRGLPIEPPKGENFIIRLLLTFIPISFFQEFLYRGFLMHMLEKVYDDRTTILLYNATLFAILHSIYPFPLATFPLVFLGGMFFAVLYMKEQNLFLVTLSHAVLNFTALALGLFFV